MKETLKEIIVEAIKDNIVEKEKIHDLENKGDEYQILSNMDSLDMVSVLVDIESKVQDEFGVDILISSERAMSAKGPFSTVGNLLSFTMKLIQEENK